MRKAVVLTAYNRLDYLSEVLESWSYVDGLRDWAFLVSIDPSPHMLQVQDMAYEFIEKMGLEFGGVVLQEAQRGVSEHPYRALNFMFKNEAFDFVVRAEDDLLVADDFLRFMGWAAEEYKDDQDVAAVFGYNGVEHDDSSLVIKEPGFCPWNWGTWKDRWDEYIAPTWDHGYDTYNGTPGHQSGFDWNLDTRVLPRLNKVCVHPAMSRVQNIGLHGTHATPAEFPQSPSYHAHFPEVVYKEWR